MFSATLVVADQPPVAQQPAEGPLDDPPAGDYPEAGRVAALDDLQVMTSALFTAAGLTVVCGVGPHQPQRRKCRQQARDQRLHAMPVADQRRGGHDGSSQPSRAANLDHSRLNRAPSALIIDLAHLRLAAFRRLTARPAGQRPAPADPGCTRACRAGPVRQGHSIDGRGALIFIAASLRRARSSARCSDDVGSGGNKNASCARARVAHRRSGSFGSRSRRRSQLLSAARRRLTGSPCSGPRGDARSAAARPARPRATPGPRPCLRAGGGSLRRTAAAPSRFVRRRIIPAPRMGE